MTKLKNIVFFTIPALIVVKVYVPPLVSCNYFNIKINTITHVCQAFQTQMRQIWQKFESSRPKKNDNKSASKFMRVATNFSSYDKICALPVWLSKPCWRVEGTKLDWIYTCCWSLPDHWWQSRVYYHSLPRGGKYYVPVISNLPN